MQYNEILLIVTCLAVVLPMVGLGIHIYEKNEMRRLNSGASKFLKKSKTNYLYNCYLFFLSFPLTKGFFSRLSRRYEILCPSDPRTIADKTMTSSILALMLCGAEIFIIFMLKPNLHNAAISIYLMFVILNEVINYFLSGAELKLLESMEIFISDVGHNYHINYLVDDAILLSMVGQSPEMKVHAQKLYDVVISTDLKEEILRYNAAMHNRYLKMFLSLCTSVIEYSDKNVNGQLLFSSNLIHLKSEINNELLKLNKLRYVFSGSVFTAVAVCLPIDAIQQFGISMVPALETFYIGREGTLLVAVILLSSVIVYTLINHAKETNRPVSREYRILRKLEKVHILKRALDNYLDKNYSRVKALEQTLKRLGENISPRQLLLKRMITALIVFSLCIGITFYVHDASRKLLISKVADIESLTTASNTKQQQLISETILRFVNIHKRDKINRDSIFEELNQDGTFYNSKMNEVIANEIVSRVVRFQNEYFKWYELLVCFAAAVIGFYTPYLMILYRKRVIKLIMEDEVNQFNSIIYLMMYIEHVTVRDILEQMELFAVVFKRSIQECINEYNSGDIEALTRLMENEAFGPFRRLVGNLIRCDSIPIDKAFNEIAVDRENYHDRRKQQNDISIQKRADTVKPMSFIPAVFVTVYLMLPMLVAGLQMLDEFKESIASLGF